jgi:cysteine desulfurase / selenocysteine lyase
VADVRSEVATVENTPLAPRADFPLLERRIHDRRLVYLDSSSSAQRPRCVLDAMDHYYERSHANVHRGVYAIAEEADAHYENARRRVGAFIGAPNPMTEVIFVKNATEGINVVANSWASRNLKAGDVVLVTEMEHHANLVPWLMLAEQIGIELRWLGIDEEYRLDLSDLDRMLEGVKLVACTVMSNVLGTIPPFRRIADAAHAAGALVVADGAQAVPHIPVDVGQLGCDFIVFSAHKMLGPTGIGALWGREELLDSMPPFLGGGGMIRDVRKDGFTPSELPGKFEAGTPPIAEAVGLGAAVDYLEAIGMDRVLDHDRQLVSYTQRVVAEDFGEDLQIFGPSGTRDRGGVISMELKGVHPHDLAQVLDQYGVCVRAGHHCAKPLMRRLGVPAAARASFYVYNDESDVDALVAALKEAATLFG